MLKRNGGEGLGPRTSYTDINGQRRISDGTTANGLIEVKNVKTQGYSKQIEAAVEDSKSRGGKLDLYVARETQVTSTTVNNPDINLHRIPREEIVQASRDVWHSADKSIFTYKDVDKDI